MKNVLRRRRVHSVVVATALAGALLIATSYAANASEGASPPDQRVTAAADPEIVDDSAQVIVVDDAAIIEGGTTQSTDPTRDDYVPQFQTLNATGVAATSAFKWTWGGITISVPGGFLGHVITGNGLRITQESAKWNPAFNVGQICNYQFRLQNRYGSRIYSTIRLPLHTGCSYFGTPTYKYEPNRSVRTGVQCARLYVNGTYRGEQCHSVFP